MIFCSLPNPRPDLFSTREGDYVDGFDMLTLCMWPCLISVCVSVCYGRTPAPEYGQ